MNRRWLLLLVLFSGLAQSEQVVVTVLATTDLHGNLYPIDYVTEPDGSYWKELVDYSDGNVLGWIIGTYVTEGIPAYECP